MNFLKQKGGQKRKRIGNLYYVGRNISNRDVEVYYKEQDGYIHLKPNGFMVYGHSEDTFRLLYGGLRFKNVDTIWI